MAAPSASLLLSHSPSPSLLQSSISHPTSRFHFRRKISHSFTISSLGNDGERGGGGGGGGLWVSPNWLSSLARSISSRGDDSGIPVANARLEDVPDLLGGALFLPLYKWMLKYGSVYRLAAGPRDFVVISDPAAAKHVLRSYGSKYAKGLVSEVSEFLFGSGFAIAEGQLWTVRRRAVLPSLHRKFLYEMVDKVFSKCALRLVEKLQQYATSGAPVNMEEKFSQLTLDIIGLSLFNYNFDSLTSDSPIINAIYIALKEAEARSTDILPYWKVELLCKIVPRQIKAERAIVIIRNAVEELIAKCKRIVEAEGELINAEDSVNDSDPSILRFLLASRDEVSSVQLRDDLLSMLVAGHETTGSVLTWTLYLLSKDSSALARAQEEVASVLRGRIPTYDDVKELKYLMRCIHESMRLYPHPPVLIRRALVDDVLPGNYKVNKGQDIMISVYNIHHSPQVWEGAENFVPERFDLEGPIPNETNTDFRFIPFSGGPRKCVGDQFALLEAIIALAIFLQHVNFELVPDQKISMTTGATIHTTDGLYMKLSPRNLKDGLSSSLRFMENPVETHFFAARRILKYIKGTLSYGMLYKRSMQFTLKGYIDSDWSNDVDERKSISGFLFYLGETPFTWYSKKQKVATLSSCEAEYIAAAGCVCDGVWLKRLMKSLRLDDGVATTVYVDNKSAIELAKIPFHH